ncbi:hypothetical protein OH687_34050 [Burkholderia anthina]|nr:hypothetical protein OH687_34050 [Burkholderia anthina]
MRESGAAARPRDRGMRADARGAAACQAAAPSSMSHAGAHGRPDGA